MLSSSEKIKRGGGLTGGKGNDLLGLYSDIKSFSVWRASRATECPGKLSNSTSRIEGWQAMEFRARYEEGKVVLGDAANKIVAREGFGMGERAHNINLFSLTKIIKELAMTKDAPTKVKIFGISLQIKYPNIIAKTKLKYLIGVTSDASANL